MPSQKASRTRRPAWNSTIHDLTVYRSTAHEVKLRHARFQSPNLELAREEVARRREKLACGGFDDTLAALAGRCVKREHDETVSALQELDQVRPASTNRHQIV